MPSYEIITGNNFALFVTFSDEEERKRVFEKLSRGGKVIMPLQDNFGMLADKFGFSV